MANNILQQVQTYQKSNLAYLQNLSCFITTCNTKFKDFEKLTANLGTTVNFDLPPRMTTVNSLVASFQPANQRVFSLTVDQEISTSYDFTTQEFVYNVQDYMEKFGKSATAEIGTEIESNVGRNAETHTFRFYGDGVKAIDSSGQLATALAYHRNFGAAKDNTKGYLDDISVASIVNSNLNQFTLDRNNRQAMSWELGAFSNCEWYQSNLLTTHVAGTEGNAGTTLTVVSTVKNSDGGIIAITFSGANAPSDPNSVLAYDKFQVSDNVSGQPNYRYLTFIGHKPSASPVQFRATADAASTAGSEVTVNIYPPLQSAAGATQNITADIVAGAEVTVLPSHRCGMITSGNPLYLAMPQMPEEVPFPTGNAVDPTIGVSIRQYYGSIFGQNQRGFVHDAIWGSTLVDEYATMIAFPL